MSHRLRISNNHLRGGTWKLTFALWENRIYTRKDTGLPHSHILQHFFDPWISFEKSQNIIKTRGQSECILRPRPGPGRRQTGSWIWMSTTWCDYDGGSMAAPPLPKLHDSICFILLQFQSGGNESLIKLLKRLQLRNSSQFYLLLIFKACR